MGQSIAKRALISKQASIYDTSVWARRYRHDFEALQLSEEQVRLMWDEYCKVSAGGRAYELRMTNVRRLLHQVHGVDRPSDIARLTLQ